LDQDCPRWVAEVGHLQKPPCFAAGMIQSHLC
jgi:hypothetical protein